MTWPGLVRLGGRWTLNPRPPTGMARQVIDELEVGAQAAKVWSWGPHYCPPGQYARIRREQQERDARRAEPAPVRIGQLELFAEAS